MRVDMEIERITVKTKDGDWIIETDDEDIYWIKPVYRMRAYRIKTLFHDYLIKMEDVDTIIIDYRESY